MSQRHISLQQTVTSGQSLEKDAARKLREAGSVSNLMNGKTSPGMFEDSQTIGEYVYRKRDQIGSGYTSHVYKCYRLKDQEQYTIKVIDMKKYSNSSLEMLDNEIQILKKLNHPNILRYENVYKHASICYLITEYCPHGDLLQYMTKKGKLCEKEATAIISQVIDATKYLFKMGVIHRDIKPANIFKGAKSWKLGDFGFSILSETEVKTKQNVGTPLYMPLQALQRNCYSPQSDVFSVGVIFYEMMVGITPWESKTEKELIRKLSSMPFSIPEKYKITSPIKFLLNKMCAPNRDERMSKEEFMDLNIGNFVSLINFNQKLKVQDFKRKGRVFSRGKFDRDTLSKGKGEGQYLTNRKLSKNQPKGTPKVQGRVNSKVKIVDMKTYANNSRKKSRSISQQKKFDQKLQQKNYEVLVNQLNYCRFMYYLIQNGNYLQLGTINRGKLMLMTFKHMLKLVKQLADSKNNWFGFTNWDTFRKSPKYQSTLKTLKQYCQKYEKQYLIFLKKAQINVIKQVNQKLPQFSTHQHFTIQFYRKMLNFLSSLLRECNHNLLSLVQDVREGRGEEGVARLQALRSLYKYYRLIEMSIRQFQNYSHFNSNSNITILKNYRQSKIGVNDYMQIRQEIKMI